jgi:hypothetical protein
MHSDSEAGMQTTIDLPPVVSFMTSDISLVVNSDMDEHIAYAVSSIAFL